MPVPQELKNQARELRSNQTDVEAKLWRRLRDRQVFGVKFRRQHPIGRQCGERTCPAPPSRHRHFCCPTLRLIVELDGGQHAEQNAADQARTCFLESRGYRVLRFWNNQVMTQLDDVLEEISSVVSTLTLPSP